MLSIIYISSLAEKRYSQYVVFTCIIACIKSFIPNKHKTFEWHLYNVGQHLRRSSNIVQMLYKYFVFTGF